MCSATHARGRVDWWHSDSWVISRQGFCKFCWKTAVHALILTCVCVLPLICQPPHPTPSGPFIPIPSNLSSHSPLLSSLYFHPLHPATILSSNPHNLPPPGPVPTLPADGEHELTSDDGSTLSQSLSVTQSPQSTSAKEGITHSQTELFFRMSFTVLLFDFNVRRVFVDEHESVNLTAID